MVWWWFASARASPLCDELMQPSPDAARLRAALVAGADPDEACEWRQRADTGTIVVGTILSVLIPVVSWPFTFPMMSDHKRSALPTESAVATGRTELVRALVDGGAHRMGDSVRDAVAGDHWDMAQLVVAAGGSVELHRLGLPLAGDLKRLGKATALGLRFDTIDEITDPGALATDPAAVTAFLKAGLPPNLLLDQVTTVSALNAVLTEPTRARRRRTSR